MVVLHLQLARLHISHGLFTFEFLYAQGPTSKD